ncbi:MAG: tRNA pseudouridine(54/55) synthase Pus10 [Thermoplasmatales archaeon]|nr:MAG: tRNA pseudouridine(54/55) synthase Pus10 [Thermoplasmatales archaeon]
MKDKKILETTVKTLDRYQICDCCVGRLFRQIETGLTNKQKGRLIRNYIKYDKKTIAKDCWLCEGLLDEIEHFADLVSDVIKKYEFDTFLIGSKIDEDILDREKKLWDFIKSENVEPIKMEINREVGKILEKKLGKTVDFENPDIVAVIDTAFDAVNLQVSSIFIYGRYKKLKRGLPQTKWFCKICRGKGCKACSYTGKIYDTSVEELVSKKALEMTKGTDESFHGSGREDIDALMLGNGRPFVLEIKNPQIRNIDLSVIEKKTNEYGKDKIEIGDIRFSDRNEIVKIKGAGFRKTYRIVLEGEKPINKEKLKEVAQILQGRTIKQFTPTRVAHRRVNKVRERKIYNCVIESVEDTVAIVTVETESGTYLKELISGDNGKTKPNISEMIGIPCIVKELDVIEIMGEYLDGKTIKRNKKQK